MKSRKYPTFQAAKSDLESKGKLEFFGRVGLNYEACLYRITLHSGSKYAIKIYDDGTVELVGSR